MQGKRSFVRAFLAVLVILLLDTGIGMAQESEGGSPSPAATATAPQAKGLCTPWHRCLAITTGGVVLLWLLSAAGMYAIQRRGFDSLEHRQGSPGGVPVPKE